MVCLFGMLIGYANNTVGVKYDELPEFELISFEDEVVTDSVTGEIELPINEPWEVVTLSGKLKMKGLPLSPNVKIFMKRDSLISMSLRAPFVGEAGNLEVTPDSVLLINKMNKTYIKESIGNQGLGIGNQGLGIGSRGLGIRDLQDLLLARFFIPGFDLELEELDDLIEIIDDEGQLNVVPKSKAEIEGVKYGFVIDNEFNPVMLVVLPQAKPDSEIDVIYDYKFKGYDIQCTYIDGNRQFGLTLELNNPEWKGEMPKQVTLNKYRKVNFEEFMRSM